MLRLGIAACAVAAVVAYAQRNKDFVLVTALVSGGFETDGVHKFVEIVNDALIEAVQLRSLLPLELAVCRDGRQQIGSQGRVDPLEQFQEYQADRVAVAQPAIAPGTRNSFHQSLDAKLRKIVPKRS